MAHMQKASPLLLFSLALGCAQEPPTFVVFGETMGTTWQLSLHEGVDGGEAYQLVQEQVDLVEALMSPWIPESDVSRFAAADVGAPISVASETLEVIELARATWEATAGAFDPTVGALVEASGFGVSVEASVESERLAARGVVGFDAIEVDMSERTITKLARGLRLDLSAIAKGYAVDRAADALTGGGYEDFFLEVGGELVCRGGNGERDDWIVGVEAPNMDPLGPRRLHTALHLTGVGVATSGDYRNRRELDGELRAHIFDPRTGESVSGALGSVTVIAPSCATADAYATAGMVMGVEAALEWLESVPGVEAIFISRGADGALLQHQTSGAERYTDDRG